MIAKNVVALLAGLLFALGLGVGGMTHPAKVTAFLDVFGRWDPSLMFVMAGAIAAHMPVALWMRRKPRPLPLPMDGCATASPIDPPAPWRDAKLLGGAAVFGVGWGIAGFCPGPALVSVGAGVAGAAPFCVGMVVSMAVHSVWFAEPRRGLGRGDQDPVRG